MDNRVRRVSLKSCTTLALFLLSAAGCTINNKAPGGYTVSGIVSGLASGQQVTLADNGTDTLTVTTGGSFTFQQPVAFSQPYAVTIATQPSGQTCSVSSGSGSSFSYNIANVNVLCTSTTYQVGGTVSGLGAGASITLVDNGTDTLAVSVDGNFNFAAPLTYNQTYAVTLSTQPTMQTCSVAMGSGTITSAVSTIAVNCAYNLEPVTAIVSGVESNATLRLLLNGGDTLPVSANGTYTFTAKDAYESPFAVTIGTQPIGQTCIAEGGVGTVMGMVNVPVVCTYNLYTVGGTVSGLSPSQTLTLTGTFTGNNSATLNVSANGTFAFPGTFIVTNTYAVTVTGPQPTGENCTVQNGTGTVMSANVNITVTCLTPENVYVVDNSGPPGTATVFNMNAGQLTPLSNAMTGSTPLSIALDPSFHYAYVVNQGDSPTSDISEYMISAVDGSLSPLSNSHTPIAARTGAQFVAVSPSGNAVYVLNGTDGTISQYALGAGTGILAPMATPTVATGSISGGPSPNPIAMAINSAATFAYVVNQGGNSVSEFSIAAGGALTLIATTATGNGPNAVAISPNGAYLYATNNTDATISEFGITAGALTALPESPASVTSGGGPTSVVVDPTNTYVYVSDSNSNIDEYTISSTDGSLSANTTAGTIGTNATANNLAFDQTGMFLFSAENNGNVDQFSLTPLTGVLVSVGTSVSTGSNAASIATAYFPPR